MNNFQLALIILLVAIGVVAASAETSKGERCDDYAREAVASSPNSMGSVRGATMGVLRRGKQESRSYQYYYDGCMAR